MNPYKGRMSIRPDQRRLSLRPDLLAEQVAQSINKNPNLDPTKDEDLNNDKVYTSKRLKDPSVADLYEPLMSPGVEDPNPVTNPSDARQRFVQKRSITGAIGGGSLNFDKIDERSKES